MADGETHGSADQQPEEEEEPFYFDPDLFVNRDYKSVMHVFDDIEVDLMCSTAASTDHDLTGQIVWPVARLMAWFAVKNRDLFRGKKVVELGAGCGITGLVVARVGAREVALTDGNEIVLEVLEENAARERALGKSCTVRCLELSWGDDASHAAFREAFGRPDVLVGADVVYWPSSVAPLMSTVARLLAEAHEAGSRDAAFYCGYVCRALQTQRALEEGAEIAGLAVDKVPIDSFLPAEHDITDYDLGLMTVYKFTLKAPPAGS